MVHNQHRYWPVTTLQHACIQPADSITGSKLWLTQLTKMPEKHAAPSSLSARLSQPNLLTPHLCCGKCHVYPTHKGQVPTSCVWLYSTRPVTVSSRCAVTREARAPAAARPGACPSPGTACSGSGTSASGCGRPAPAQGATKGFETAFLVDRFYLSRLTGVTLTLLRMISCDYDALSVATALRRMKIDDSRLDRTAYCAHPQLA